MGGTGDIAKICGEGGEGEGPHVEFGAAECWKIGNVSGEFSHSRRRTIVYGMQEAWVARAVKELR